LIHPLEEQADRLNGVSGLGRSRDSRTDKLLPVLARCLSLLALGWKHGEKAGSCRVRLRTRDGFFNAAAVAMGPPLERLTR
jgi:hypothetical protein